MAREITYNLPGYGFANCYLLGQAMELMDMLEERGIVDKMKNTCQLGTMKYVYPGAHHTRYEYVFTQLMLISNVVSSKEIRNTEISITSNLKEYKNNKLSGGALMQCLAILSNAGHMYDTFTTSRILMRLLHESKSDNTEFYLIYKRNLPKAVRRKFDEYLSEGNYYKLHLFNVIQLVQGMSRKSKYKNLCALYVKIISQLIDSSLIKNEATQRVFALYKKIRKIAYLSVDMVYTPASFGANLSRMVYSISSYVDDLFDGNSAMNSSIIQLEDIIHKQIYDSAICILNTARIEHDLYGIYKEAVKNVHNIFELRNLLLEEGENRLSSKSQPKAIRDMDDGSLLLLSKEFNATEVYDLSREAQIAASLPLTRIVYGTQLTQNLKRIYTAYGLITTDNIPKDVQVIISNAIGLGLCDEANKVELVKYAIRSIYTYGEYFFNLSAPEGVSLNDCVFIGQGCKKMASEIQHRLTEENVPNLDQLHEILSCATVLESLNYNGTVMCFVGGVKASSFKNTSKVDELDGFIYFPNKSPNNGFAYIVEAKNYSGGEHDAEKQLKETCKYLDGRLKSEVTRLDKCAYLKLSI